MGFHPLQELFDGGIVVFCFPDNLKIHLLRCAVTSQQRKNNEIPGVVVVSDSIFRKDCDAEAGRYLQKHGLYFTVTADNVRNETAAVIAEKYLLRFVCGTSMGLHNDKILLCQIPVGKMIVTGQGMTGIKYCHQRKTLEKTVCHILVALSSERKIQDNIAAVIFQMMIQGAHVIADQMQGNIGISLPEGAQSLRKAALLIATDKTNGKLAGNALRGSTCQLGSLLGTDQDGTGFVEIDLSGSGKLYVMLVPDKQRNPQTLFQRLDLQRDGCLGNIAFFRGFCKVSYNLEKILRKKVRKLWEN